MPLVDVSDISKMLAGRIDDLVCDILPGARKHGHEWRCGGIDGSAGASMAVHSGGTRAGVWADFADSAARGDALDLVAYVLFAGDKKRAVQWAKSWLGIDGLDPARIAQEQRRIRQKAKQVERAAIEQAERRARRAKAIWLNASKDLAGSPVELYLLGRGIGLADLPRAPGALRYADALDYYDQVTGEITPYPAMVASIVNGAGQFIAVHRTYLKDHGAGLVTKAPVANAKLALGGYRGGFIPLSRGAGDRSLREAKPGDRVILCEGIEDGLTLAASCPDWRVLACISVGNFQAVDLPPAVSDVVIAADNDAPGSKAAASLQAAVDVFIAQGRSVRVARAPGQAKDFNDMLGATHGSA